MKWAYNEPDAVIRYVARASHVTAIIGKTIAERFYTKRPSRSYFIGCSAGGMQGMMEAERFPWDFDGIVAGDPSLSVSEDWLNLVWAHRALMDDRGNAILASKDLETLHRAVIAQCDMNDGVKDGLIGDPRRCNFDPEKLSCVAGFGQTCLSSTQIESVRKIYQGPVTSEGRSITPRHVFVGSELSWHDWFGGSERASTGTYSYMPEWFRYYLFQPNPGPSWSVESLDFDRDYQRFGLAELTEPVNPDLRRLQRKGGKLILYTGWDDPVAGVGRAIDYYESAERLIGGRTKTQEFFRLFVIPGMNHCTGGEGAFAIDYLSALEAWVEEGHAPSELEAAHVKVDDLLDKATQGDAEAWHELQRRLQFPLDPTHVEFSRPIYPYPIQTHYLGHGNRNEAASFGPVSAPRMDP